MKEKSKSRIIYIVFIVVLYLIIYRMTGKMIDNQKSRLLISIGFTLVFSTVVTIPFLPLIIARKVAVKNVQYEKLSRDDIINNKQMYRDILEKYFPSELLYIDTMKYDYRKTIISTLLYLKQKRYITINDNLIIKEKEIISKECGKVEKTIMENIEHGKISVDYEKLKNTVIEDSIKNGIVEANDDIEKKVINKLIKAAILYICLLLISFIIFNQKMPLLSVLYGVILSVFPIGTIMYAVNYYKEYSNNPWYRTSKGEEINLKLEGLKNYLREYSLLNKRESDEIEIWEDYLIYSVMFGQNEKIIKEYEKFIKK